MNLAAKAKRLSETEPQVRAVRQLEEKQRKAERRIKELEQLAKEQERLIEHQAERIERQKHAKYKFPKPGTRDKAAASYVRFVVPDTHGCFAVKEAVAAMLGDMRALARSVREVVLLGDHLDCGGFLAQHHTWGYVAEADYTFDDDAAAANTLLDDLQSVCTNAEFDYIEGNHERRIERWCVTQSLSNKQNAAYLASLYCTEGVLSLEKRGIRYFKQGRFYDGLRIPATIKRGNCYFTHGERTGENAAQATLNDFGGNVVFGHIHRPCMAPGKTVRGGEIGAWCPGCLSGLQPLWNHSKVTRWQHGYGLQLVRENGDFLHINVPIIDGKSYMMQLTEKMQ